MRQEVLELRAQHGVAERLRGGQGTFEVSEHGRFVLRLALPVPEPAHLRGRAASWEGYRACDEGRLLAVGESKPPRRAWGAQGGAVLRTEEGPVRISLPDLGTLVFGRP